MAGTTSAFTGGVSDGQDGVAVMQHNLVGISSHKSWFMLGDRVVALGAGITASLDYPVYTTLNQEYRHGAITVSDAEGIRTLGEGTHSLEQADWIFHDGVGYTSLDPQQKFGVRNAVQSGAWSHINATSSTATFSTPVFTAWIDHGSTPSNDTYAYLIAPGTSIDEVANPDPVRQIQLISNTTALQALFDPVTRSTAAVFHQPGQFVDQNGLSIAADHASLVLLKWSEDNAELQVTAANPLNQSLVLRLTLSMFLDDPHVLWDSTLGLSQITLLLPGGEYAGDSITQTFTIPEPSSTVLLGLLGILVIRSRRHPRCDGPL